jgi:hypothetical protein
MRGVTTEKRSVSGLLLKIKCQRLVVTAFTSTSRDKNMENENDSHFNICGTDYDVLELIMFPRIGGSLDHGQGSIVLGVHVNTK